MGGPVPKLENPVKSFTKSLTMMNVAFSVMAALQMTVQYLVNLNEKKQTEQDILAHNQKCALQALQNAGEGTLSDDERS